MNADGVPIPSFSLTQSPTGMTIDSTTGVISWMPTVAGNFDVIVAADNGATSDTQSFAIDVTNNQPTTSGIGNFNLNANASDQTINLFDSFDDSEQADSTLIYTIQSNSNPSLVSTTIDSVGGTLTLGITPNQIGSAALTVRATDIGGLFADASFTVQVTDVTPPTLTLLGNSQMMLLIGSLYDDPGTLAFDDVDGDITATVVRTGTVDTQQVGTYTLTYDVNDSSGNTAQSVTRAVTVIEMLESTSTLTSEGVHADLMWPALAGASWYHIVLVNDEGQVWLDVWQEADAVCNGYDCKFVINSEWLSDGLYSDDYQWYLQGWDGDFSPWYSGTFAVQVEPPLAPQIAVNPNQGRPTLSWNNDVRTLYIQIYIGQVNGEMSYLEWHKRSDLCDETICTLSPNVDLSAGTYEVYAQPWGPGGFASEDLEGWIGPVQFDLNFDPPEAVTGLLVEDTGGGTFDFSWQGTARATWYQIWVGTSEFHYQEWYLASELGCENLGDCQIAPNVIFPAGTYEWYVRAWGPGGFSFGGVIDGWAQGPMFQR